MLDCFAGSGTTLEAACQLGRLWIGIDNSSEAIHTTLYRFAHGTKPMGDFVKRSTTQQNQPNIGLFRITDFALHVSEPYNGDIDELIVQWQGWTQ